STQCLAQVSFQGLGFLPGHNASAASAVSADGTVVVGTGSPNNFQHPGDRGFRWVGGTMTAIAPLAGTNNSYANAVSADGTVVAGTSGNCGGYSEPCQAFSWTNGITTGLGSTSGDHYSIGFGISGNGSVVVGRSFPNIGSDCSNFVSEYCHATRFSGGA